jgi:phospholipid/cholesterol/gamma-HCH transport system permease protein
MNLILSLVAHVGGVSQLLWRALLSLKDIRKVLGPLAKQMNAFGVNSLPLVILTSVFVGMVAAIQTAYQVRDYVSLDILGGGVFKAVVIELGPVLTALVVAGRMSAGIAAELGTMRVTEQIDALECMAIDPVRHLVLPRLLSGIIMLPILTIIAEAVAIGSAGVVSDIVLGLPREVFFESARTFFKLKDVLGGLSKSFVFGFAIAIMGSYHGFTTEGGAEGVGRASTRAVVASSFLILMTDYILGAKLFGG